MKNMGCFKAKYIPYIAPQCRREQHSAGAGTGNSELWCRLAVIAVDCSSERFCGYRHLAQKVRRWFLIWGIVLEMTQGSSVFVTTANRSEWVTQILLNSYWTLYLCSVHFSLALFYPTLTFPVLFFFFFTHFCSWWSRNQLCLITQWPRKLTACISTSAPPVHLPKID